MTAPASAAHRPVVWSLFMGFSLGGKTVPGSDLNTHAKVTTEASPGGDGRGLVFSRRSGSCRRTAAQVNARDPLVEAGQDLVGNGPRRLGHGLHADGLRALPADQDHLVLVERAVLADVHHELVHAHAPGDRVAAATDQYLATRGQRARPAVAVADRYRDHAGVAPRCPGRA